MPGDEFIKDTLILRNQEIPVKVGHLSQADLRFYPENPRVYSIVCTNGQDPTQEEIEKTLTDMEHVRQLRNSIMMNGGLTDPVFVRDKTFVVLEGNSRLAAYRLLAQKDPIRWDKIKCKILPETIGDDQVFALLGEYHIIGRKDWVPYEQAGYLYRRHTRAGISVKQMAEEVGLTAAKVQQLVKVYTFMVEHNDNRPDRWSYYEEYLKSAAVKRLSSEQRKELDKTLVSKVKSGEINLAVDVRDKLPKIVTAGSKTLGRFLTGKKDFEQSYQSAIEQGAGNACLKKLSQFRIWIGGQDVEEDLCELTSEPLKKSTFELKKIRTTVERLMNKLQQK
jgi:hypothetical protein